MIERKLYAVVSPAALALMGGVRGKLCAQTGHAFLHAYWDAQARFPEAARSYRDDQAAPKITLTLAPGGTLEDDEHALLRLKSLHEPLCGVTFVRDAARTVFKTPTVTCIGIGPILPDERHPDLALLRPLT